MDKIDIYAKEFNKSKECMRTKILIALLFSLCLLVSCFKIDYDKLRSREGIMMYVGSTSYELQYEGSNDCVGVGYRIDWNGNVIRTVGYQITDTLYDYAVFSDEDYKTLYEFAESSRKKDPFKEYSEIVYDGWIWEFEYYYSEDEDPFEIYKGYCYNQEDLQKILEMLHSYFPEIKYIPAPTEEVEHNPDPSGNAEYNSAPTGETVVDTLTPKGYVSVDLFKSFYGLDDEIDDRFIEDFILFQQITEDDMFEYDYSKDLIESFDNVDYSQFGYSMNWNELNFQELTLNNRTDITNAIDNARWIYMVFEVPIPDCDETERVTMLSDFHHDMFYYAVNEDNYHNSGRKLALTELAKEIQVDMIPEDAERQNPDRDKYALSYKYDVYIFTYDRKYIHISNDTYYRFHQSFNVYWQLVYYREFNEEFEVSAAGT